MKAVRKLVWVFLIAAGIAAAYFGSYLILLHPVYVAGGGTMQRIPCYVNPFTGYMVPHHLQISYFFEPARKIDARLRPGYWCWRIR
jgi:hypothetical protein